MEVTCGVVLLILVLRYILFVNLLLLLIQLGSKLLVSGLGLVNRCLLFVFGSLMN